MERRITVQRRHWLEDVYWRAQEMLSEEPSPTGAEIARRLTREFESSPDEKTIRDWIRKGVIRPSDRDRPWSMEDGEPEDAALVFELIQRRAADPTPELRLRWPTFGQGLWMARIRRAFHDLDYSLVWHLAALANRDAADRHRVEAFLAFTPWRDRCAALGEAIARGQVGYDVAQLGGFGSDGCVNAAAMAELRLRAETDPELARRLAERAGPWGGVQ